MPLTLTPGQLNQRAHFYQQFGQVLAAGIRIIDALEMLQKNPPARSYREPLRRMILLLSQGATFAEAMREQGKWMPAFDIALISAGEQSGRLDAVCRLLAVYYEDRARLLRQMIMDLAYPLFVLHFAVFLFPFISWFQGGTTVAGFVLMTFGVLIPLYVLTFAFIYAAQGKHGTVWRSVLETVLRPIPVLGKARHYLALSRLAAALEALINAGVTIIEAWEMAATASGSIALNRVVLAWKPKLVKGGQTPAELVRSSSLFPEFFANLYFSGEISGQLDDSLRRLHRYYQEEGSRKLHLLAQWVPRFIYFGVAGFVAYKVINFYLGYFGQLNEIMK